MFNAIVTWFETYQFVAIWLEGVALVAIFILDWRERRDQRSERAEQHRETLTQLEVSQKQVEASQNNAAATKAAADAAKASTDALVNSERAWLVAELVPTCRKFGNQWHRPAGDSWASLSEDEIVSRYYLRHKLKRDLQETAVFRGCVKYLHIFNDSEIQQTEFYYSYSPSTMALVKIPPDERRKDPENPN
jgi:hypothetical protein